MTQAAVDPAANPQEPLEQVESAPARVAIPRAVLATYGLPRMMTGLIALPIAAYLAKYGTDVLLLPPAAIGYVSMIARLWDGVTDPLIGYCSDRSRSRMGRRRFWMMASVLPFGLSVFLLWSPPTSLTGIMLILWVGAAWLLYETASTMFLIPHGALGVELSEDYHERTRLFGWQHLFGGLGQVAAIAVYSALLAADDPRNLAFGLSIWGAILISSAVGFAAWRLPERAEFQGRGSVRPLRAFLDVLHNPHARLLLLMYGIETLGAGSVFMLAPFVAQYVYGQPEIATLITAFYVIPQTVLTPLWIVLARRIEKKRLWLGAMGVSCLGFLAQAQMTGEQAVLICFVAASLGLCRGIGEICAPAIKADIIDFDEYLTGERKEGTYLAAWNLVRKASAAATPALAMLSLQLSGYVPNEPQSPTTQGVILFFYGALPALSFAVGIVIFLRFGLGSAEHAAIQRELRTRR